MSQLLVFFNHKNVTMAFTVYKASTYDIHCFLDVYRAEDHYLGHDLKM